MSRIVRWEFMGSAFRFWVLCVTIIGIPVALIYLVNCTVKIETEVDDPEKVIVNFRDGRQGK
jgi:hypothetical protein